MKKILAVLLLGLFVSMSFAGTAYISVGNAPGVKCSPEDVWIQDLATKNTASSNDTFAAADIKVFGPYPLSRSNEDGIAKSIYLYAHAITGTTPTMSLDYQLIPSLDLKDTGSTWVSPCTLGTTSKSAFVDLSSINAKAIVIRVNNYDGTACQIPGKLFAAFRQNFTYLRK